MGPVVAAGFFCLAVFLCKPGLLGHGALARRARMLGGWQCAAQAAWILAFPWWLGLVSSAPVLVLCVLCRFHRIHEQLLRAFLLEIFVHTQMLKEFWHVSLRACALLLAAVVAGAFLGQTAVSDACVCTALLTLKLCCNAWRTDLTAQDTLLAEMSSTGPSASRALLVFVEEMKTYVRTNDRQAKQRADAAVAPLRWRPAFFDCYVAYLSWTTQRFLEFNAAVPVTEVDRENIAAELSICLTCTLCVGPVLALRAFGLGVLCYVFPVLYKACLVLAGLACSAAMCAWTVVWQLPGALESALKVYSKYCDYRDAR
jgi:hypothetical protein